MYSDENKSSNLAKFLNNFDYVLIDTCSLMDESFPEWMDILRDAKAYHKKELEILVPRRCYDELKKHARTTNKHEDSKRVDAKRGLKIVRHARWSGLLHVTKKDKNENFADNAIYVKVSNDRLFAKILVITQDQNLASDLRALNLLKSQSGRHLEVCKFVAGGALVPNKGSQNPKKEQKGHFAQKTNQTPAPEGVEGILQADARLSACLGNPNYPKEKKASDALAQLAAIEALPSHRRNQLNLLVGVEQLKAYANGTPVEPKLAKSAKPEPAPKPAKPAKPEEPKPERLWYGKGETLADAFRDCGQHYGIVFHEVSVKYFKEGHGPFDLDTKDLEAIQALALPLLHEEEKASFTYRGLPLAAQRHGDKFRAWIDMFHLPEQLEAKKKPATRKKTVKPAEEPKAEETPQEPVTEKPATPAPKATKPRKKAAKPAESTEEPKAEKPAVSEKTPVTEPVKKPARKTAAKKPAKETPAEPAPAQEEPAADPMVAVLEVVKRADARLSANLSNPNYDPKKKVRDAKKQLDLLQSLTEEQKSSLALRLSPVDINAWLEAHPLPEEPK